MILSLFLTSCSSSEIEKLSEENSKLRNENIELKKQNKSEIETLKNKLKEQKEEHTKISAIFSSTGTITMDWILTIDLRLESISELIINDKNIEIQWKDSLQYKLDLVLWENHIKIIWKNNDIIKKVNYNIKRVSEEEFKRLEKEKNKCLFPWRICYKKLYTDLPATTNFKERCEKEGLKLVWLDDFINDAQNFSYYMNFTLLKNLSTFHFFNTEKKWKDIKFGNIMNFSVIKPDNKKLQWMFDYFDDWIDWQKRITYNEWNLKEDLIYNVYFQAWTSMVKDAVKSHFFWVPKKNKKIEKMKVSALCYNENIKNLEVEKLDFIKNYKWILSLSRFLFEIWFNPWWKTVIKDKKTGLHWQSDWIISWRKDWFSAKKYCSNLSLWYNKKWRLPTKEELKSLLSDNKKYNPFTDNLGWYWTTTKDKPYNWYEMNFIVSFTNGIVKSAMKSTKMNVRCVY